MNKLIFFLNILFGIITTTGFVIVFMSFFLLIWGIDLPVIFLARTVATSVITLALWAFLGILNDIINY